MSETTTYTEGKKEVEKIAVKPEMLDHRGLRIDLSDIMGSLNYLIEYLMEREIEDELDKFWDLLPDLSWEDLQDLASEKIGDDLDPYAVIDLDRMLPVMGEYLIAYFLAVTELHGVIGIVPCESESMSDRFCKALDPFTVELYVKPYDLHKAWIETVGGEVEIDRSRYGRHVSYTEDQAVVIEVLREIFEGNSTYEGNIFALEDFSASVGVGEFMRWDRYEKWEEEINRNCANG